MTQLQERDIVVHIAQIRFICTCMVLHACDDKISNFHHYQIGHVHVRPAIGHEIAIALTRIMNMHTAPRTYGVCPGSNMDLDRLAMSTRV